ncbi:MAG: TIGR00730 family Rossman fold protein [Planctomycetota bacterium]|nr:TIGR00730 family Rossman fold protein [Planctomycetota bacterium]
MIQNVTVYCSSSSKTAAIHRDAANALGQAIAKHGWGLVYGGNYLGLMGILADAVRAAGGKVIGITPQLFIDEGVGDHLCDELVITPTLRDRKHLLEQRGDALIALPGGLGTLEETFEVLVGKSLGLHQKPIVLLNIENYYRPLLEMIQHGIDQKFIKPTAQQLYFVADSVNASIDYLTNHAPPATPVNNQLISTVE